MGNYSSINQTIYSQRQIYQKNQIKMEEKFILFYNRFTSNYQKPVKKLSKYFYENYYKNDIINKFIFSSNESISLKIPDISIKTIDYKIVNLYKSKINTKIIKINIGNKINEYYNELIYTELFEIFNESYNNDIKIIISNMIVIFYNLLLQYIKIDFVLTEITENHIKLKLKNGNTASIDYDIHIIRDTPPSYEEIYPEPIIMESHI